MSVWILKALARLSRPDLDEIDRANTKSTLLNLIDTRRFNWDQIIPEGRELARDLIAEVRKNTELEAEIERLGRSQPQPTIVHVPAPAPEIIHVQVPTALEDLDLRALTIAYLDKLIAGAGLAIARDQALDALLSTPELDRLYKRLPAPYTDTTLPKPYFDAIFVALANLGFSVIDILALLMNRPASTIGAMPDYKTKWHEYVSSHWRRRHRSPKDKVLPDDGADNSSSVHDWAALAIRAGHVQAALRAGLVPSGFGAPANAEMKKIGRRKSRKTR